MRITFKNDNVYIYMHVLDNEMHKRKHAQQNIYECYLNKIEMKFDV